MGGTKIHQLKAAMLRILKDLNEGDRFNIIRFSGGVTYWKPEMQMYKRNILLNALSWVDNLAATGGKCLMKFTHFVFYCQILSLESMR